jgi:hypothetical protein
VSLRVLELGNYVAPAYAGMILAEQGAEVVKWTATGRDPILTLKKGRELWAWINHKKRLFDVHPRTLVERPWGPMSPDIIIDNFRPSTLAKWGIDPAALAKQHGVVWVSLRSEVGEVSFDILAQHRAWRHIAPWMPFYIGDTAAGLWLAFKALAMLDRGRYGHYPIGHATSLAKLVEGELVVDRPTPSSPDQVAWDCDRYGVSGDEAIVEYGDEWFVEPARHAAWQRTHLWHDGTGRMTI